MNFQLTSVCEYIGENKAVCIFMTVDDKTFNCANHISSFKDAESCWLTLEATFKTLIKNCYKERE